MLLYRNNDTGWNDSQWTICLTIFRVYWSPTENENEKQLKNLRNSCFGHKTYIGPTRMRYTSYDRCTNHLLELQRKALTRTSWDSLKLLSSQAWMTLPSATSTHSAKLTKSVLKISLVCCCSLTIELSDINCIVQIRGNVINSMKIIYVIIN